MNKETEEVDVLGIAKKIPIKLILGIGIGIIVALLMLASHNYGYGNGYNYVRGYYEDYYIQNYCKCWNETQIEPYKLNLGEFDIENTIS